MRLEGKTAIVTGAAQGFGAAIARRFAAEGARVACLDIQASAAEEIARDVGGLPLHADVSDGAAVLAATKAAIAEFGKVDIFVNNAGWSHRNQPMLDVDYDTFRRVYAINVDSIYHSTRAVVPHWREIGGGVMLNVGSTAGLSPRPGLTWYNSTKGAVHLMTKGMAVELAADRIRVNALAPVAGETPLLETFMGEDTPEIRSKFLSTIPVGRFCQPKDLANAALYLCSDEADFMTGVILPVDGGRTI